MRDVAVVRWTKRGAVERRTAVTDVRERVVEVAARWRGHVLLELDPTWLGQPPAVVDVVLDIIEGAMSVAYENGGRGTTVVLRLCGDGVSIHDERAGTTVEVRLPL